jgi:hypothetical protein
MAEDSLEDLALTPQSEGPNGALMRARLEETFKALGL